jgi:hypothetical protein
MKRILMVLTVALVMAAMMAVSATIALAEPPVGAGDAGCEQGQINAFNSIGTGNASGETRAPYFEQPIGENGKGKGPGHGFTTSEDNTRDISNCQ